MKKIVLVILFIFSFTSISQSENFNLKKIASLAKPWGSTFINDRELLITEKIGKIKLVNIDDGKIIALDKNEQTNKVAINFFKKAKQDHKITTLIKPALESLDEIKEKFELIFIDADKGNYKEYYERSLSLLETSGLIIIDNVLWYGEVTKKNEHDKITQTIKNFNEFVSNDKRVEKTIIPLGDGMTICRKL